MGLEIERKFLLRTADWRALVARSSRIIDGLMLSSGDRKLRVRIRDQEATLTYKGARRGLARDEFEYPIPLDDARHLMAQHCEGHILSKTRYDVPYLGFLWEIDVYEPPLNGVILAEVELTDAAVHLPLPEWLGEEVTG